jgi:ubiquitin fusion degradation protein 1
MSMLSRMFGDFGGDPGQGGGGGPGWGFGVPQGRFDELYACFPVSFLGKGDTENGNKIFLPQSALDKLARLQITYPMLFEVTSTTTGMRTHVGVLEFIAEEGCCHIPYFIMQNLCMQEGDMLQVANVSLPKGSFVKLQPLTSDFLDVHNPRAVLENTLRNYATLTKGDHIVIPYNKKTFEIEILECKPADAIQSIEADVQVAFAPPKDYREPAPVASTINAPPAEEEEDEEEEVDPFTGEGRRIDGKAPKKVQRQTKPKDPKTLKPWLNRLPGGIIREAPYGFARTTEGKRRASMAQKSDLGSTMPK